jgi:predicted nucleic acid-binding Zn ribbon protein
MTKFRLTKSQISSLKKAARERKKVTLTLSMHQIDPNGIEIQVDRGLLSDGKRHRVTFHPPEMKEGGILPLIPLIIGTIAAAAGTAGGVSTIVKNVKQSRSADAVKEAAELKKKLMQENMNEYSGSGFYLKKQGNGLGKIVANAVGDIAMRALHKIKGNGYHLKGNGFHLRASGSGMKKRKRGKGLKKRR